MEAIVYRALFASSNNPQQLTTTDTPPMMPSYFFRLPSELKLEVIDYLDDRRDLYNVSRACRWLEDVVLRRLYNSVDIEVPSQQSPAWKTGHYLKLRSHVVKAIRDITVWDQLEVDAESSTPNHSNASADSPETYFNQIIAQIPINQLASFSSMHRQPVTPATLRLLGGKYWKSLKRFSCYELGNSDIPPSALPTNLLSIECRTIGDGQAIGRLVQANKSTLRSLCLGEEGKIVTQYMTEANGRQVHSAQSLMTFKKCMDLSEIQNLRQLSLVGLDLTPIVPHVLDEALSFTRIEELTVESCAGTPAFLSAMTSVFTLAQSEAAPEPRQPPSLRKFLLRQEVLTIDMKDALLRFMNSFSGLCTLSLMFENGLIQAKPADLITNHGSTLEHLVLESRVQPRQNLRLDTSRPFGSGGYSSQMWEQSMIDICSLCPNVSELGIGFPWNDETIRLRPSSLPSLLHLKTMHIRNFPENSRLSQMGDYSIREHATKFMEWTYANIQGDRPHLETLSIGPTIYESRFKGSNAGRKQVPEYLRTHHFTLDWAKTRFGRWSPLITSVSEKYMEETRCEKPLGGVFEQVWLK